MGFPASYTELLLPKLFLHALSFLGFLRKLISLLFGLLGLQDFLEPDIPWPSHHHPDAAALYPAALREILPVAKFSDLLDPPECCAVCLYDFEPDHQIRPLPHCSHVFHRACVDRWIGYGHTTCPLCRTVFIPPDLRSAGSSFDDRLWEEEEEDSQMFEPVHADLPVLAGSSGL